MTVELNETLLHQAGIGSFFRPSQLEPLGIPITNCDNLRGTKLSSASAGASTGLPTPNPPTLLNRPRLRPSSQLDCLPPLGRSKCMASAHSSRTKSGSPFRTRQSPLS